MGRKEGGEEIGENDIEVCVSVTSMAGPWVAGFFP